MKISLKTQLFAAFFGMIVFFVLLSIILSSTLLEKYYYSKKEDAMQQTFNTIRDAYSDDPDNIMLYVEKIENLRGMGIIFFDQHFNVLYQSRQRAIGLGVRNFRINTKDPVMDWKNIEAKFKKVTVDKPFIEKRFDMRMESSFVSLYGKIDDEVYVYLGTPVAAIQESAKIAVRFYIFTGIFMIIVGGIIIYLLSLRLTKPIVKLNGIAKKMAVLDFEEKYDEKRNDEIGTLGESINSLSNQLECSIGELKAANYKLMQDIEKERQIDEMRKGFISNISHELKTPIALVQGYAEGLKLNVNDDEENKNYYCEVIIDEANKMNNMVRKLLELSELEFNDVVLDREEFCICELIRNLLKKNSLLLAEKGAEVTFDTGGNDSIRINADYYLTEQVLMNYVSNGLNHLEEGGVIAISTRVAGRKVRVEVFNSGENIPEEALENIWLSFYKVDKARTRAYGGTGLGLSIVKAIQKAHGNGYGVKNKPGGVLFWFECDLL
ncbi:alkaline phosphatase synthesis sensor protein PhoR [Ruminiclostridium hungatei]|uniref:histidine kinase n=2 Tax=Ruminiclostridium hungatei TaxID=48256 RepID=A0A1V4SKE8_RUMHU|nr:HAMP domain-containing sensor histidine kinase [Ruminiclostridium hungatei]OPX44358.1 alkaline phosphatase synthesis sensor protein PhoR [Ruminiclostridium hungatei]